MKKSLLKNFAHSLFWVLSLLISFTATAQTIQTFGSSGTWTCPVGVSSIFVETWGAGGAGGGIAALATGGGGGGGGGSYSSAVINVVAGTTYSYVVGTGGVGIKGAGPAGGSSSFNSAVIAAGGAGGSTGPSGALGLGATGVDYGGGDGSAGVSGTRGGAGGGGAGSTTAGGDASSTTAGTGGSTGGGAGGAGRTTSGAGNSGTTLGGGGGGAYATVTTGFNGGNGANGQVQLTYLSCGSLATNTATVTTTSMNWSTAANWSQTHVPTACEDVVIIVNRTAATTNETVNITIPAFNVHSLTIRNISSSAFQVLVAANVTSGSTVNIFGDLTIETYKGAVGAGCPNNRTAFGGTNNTYNIYGNMILGRPAASAVAATEGHSTVQGQPSVWNLGGDLTFNPKGYNTNRGTNYKLNAGGTHYMVNNTNPPVYNDTIKGNRFETINIGNANPSTIILSGTRYDFSISTLIAGDLNIGVNSILDIPANYSFNITVVSGSTTSTLRLAAGAKLRVGGDQSLVTADGSNLGVAGSNFPGSYDVYTLDPTSTVEYYGSNAITQTIYNGATYGHLWVWNSSGSGRAIKQTTGALNVATSFLISALTDVYLNTATGLGTSTAPVSCAGPLTVAATGGLYCNANVVSGAGAFTMNAGSYLGMGHAQGITSGAFATGNIQMTGGRTFTTTGNYIYNGLVAQITGTGLPSTCNDLTTDNPTTVTLATNQIVTGVDSLKQGVFDIGTNDKVTITGTGRMNSIGGKMKANLGILEMNGSSGTAQSLAGSWFVNRNISTLINSNTKGITLASTANDTLLISSALLYGSATTNSTITTNGNLTLLSRDTATARFGQIVTASGNSITGNVNVERYIGNSARKWRQLAWPTTSTQNCLTSWMEGNSPNGNTKSGYGTIVTDATTNWSPNGFDSKSLSGPSVKYYNSATNNYSPIPNTTSYAMNTNSAYFNFVRGDRACTPLNGTVNATILRTTGALKTGNQVFTVLAGKYAAIGNPYASAIDIRLVDTANLTSTFQVWDPKLTGLYGLGAYQTLYASGAGYKVMPGGGSYGALNSAADTIESGQAFFVKAQTGLTGSLTVKESSKQLSARTMQRGGDENDLVMPGVYPLLSLDNDSSTELVDGCMINYNGSFSSDIDDWDIAKIANGSENVSFLRNGKLLSIERRAIITQDDTLFINVTGYRVHKYKWDITIDKLDDDITRTGFLIDNFLGTSTALDLNSVNTFLFNVDGSAGSNAANRFMIVFKQPARILPVRFTSISAVRNTDKTVTVKWHTETEINMQNYKIEHSDDGISFTEIGTQLPSTTAGGAAGYSFDDIHATTGMNYYRVRGNSMNGQVQYTAIVKVGPIGKNIPVMSIYPNPVAEGNVNLRFENQPKGNYTVNITNKIGQLIHTETVVADNNNFVRTINLGTKAAPGGYQVTVADASGKSTTIPFVIQ